MLIFKVCLLLVVYVDKSSGQAQPVFISPDPNAVQNLIELDEGTPAGTVILTIQTVNPNDVITIESVSALPTGAASDIGINAGSKAVVLNIDLDYEVTTRYIVVVRATDQGSQLFDNVGFVLQVKDINDNPPVISGTLSTSFPEEQPASTTVFLGSVFSVTDRDAGDSHTFALTGLHSSFFHVDANSGDITMVRRLDRDLPGATTLFDQLALVAVDSGYNSGTASLTVTLTDINDNAPVCTPTLTAVFAAEDFAGTVATLTCHDDDDGANSAIGSYVIASGDDALPKFTMTGAAITASSLDYETTQQYTLIIKITDSGTPPVTGTATVVVQVTGVNDNTPVWRTFTPAGPTFTLKESGLPGTTVTTLAASDADAGPDGEIEFVLMSVTDALTRTVGGLFSLDPVSGKLTTISYLDYDVPGGTSYTLTVRAQDKGSPVRSAVDQTLTVNIQDGNDNSPVFSQPSYTKDLAESYAMTGAGAVLQVSATDKDQGGGGTLQYRIVGGDPQNKFRFSTTTPGLLELNAAIDIDRPAQEDYFYVLTVQANDAGVPSTPARTGTATVAVSITPENENPPVFGSTSPASSINIPESTPVGTSVAQVSATDDDVDRGVPQTLSYKIVGGDPNNDFTLDPVTGILRLAKPLDFETGTNLYVIMINATDKGVPVPLVSRTTIGVTITVTDVNEGAPTCSSNTIIANVPEKSVQTVTTIPCTGDPGENLSYSFTSSQPLFQIDATTGEVSTLVGLDYETSQTHVLTIAVRDSLAVPAYLTSTVTLTVHVQPVNEFSPVFNPITYSAAVDENMPGGATVVTVTATDNDKGALDGTIRYSIVSGNGLGCFAINSSTGEITTAAVPLDREANSVHTLTVRAADDIPGATTERTATVQVTVTVRDVNDNAPLCTPVNYQTGVVEPAAKGNTVLTLTSKDDDEANTPYATVSYLINGGNTAGVFDVVGSDIVLRQEVDYETTKFYSLTIVAHDNGGNPGSLSSTCRVDVTIVAANEYPPTPVQSGFRDSLSETTPVGASVYTAVFNDQDKDTGALWNYTITSGNTNNDFYCYPSTGEIVVWNPLDYDKPPQAYNLTITATDDGGRTGSMWLYVDLTDVNDHTPVFTQNVYVVSIREDAGVSATVTTVSAIDPDIGDHVTYTAVSGNGMQFFEVHPGTGEVTVKTAGLDCEARDRYSLVVKAADTDTPPHSATALVDIRLTDVNDETPAFTPADFTVNIPETSTPGTTVTTVFAVDADRTASNNQFDYVFTDPMFSMDATGRITTTGGVDREIQARYVLTVKAIDKGAPPNTGTATITVILDDINDSSPTITGLYRPSVKEDVAVGSVITKITADDADEGENARLTYAITGGNLNGDFKIDPDSGIIQVQKALDREHTNSYKLVVEVSDNGSPRLTATTTVTITITDVNDEHPVWTQPSYTFHVTEEANPPVSVGTVHATDRDVGQNQVLIYRLPLFWSGNPAHFLIHRNTGEVVTAAKLDRETTAQYFALARVIDQGTPQLSAVVNVTIVVDDINDNPPVFNSVAYTATTTENMPVGTEILRVTVTDADVGNNAQYTLSIDTSTPAGARADAFLQVTSPSGVISVKQLIDREHDSKFSFTLVAVDSGTGGNALRSSAVVTIQVVDENDNVPVFTKTYYNKEIANAGQCTKSILTVTATDADSGTNGEVAYFLAPSPYSHLFSVDSASGVFSLQSGATAGSMYTLNVSARDKGTPTNTAATLAKVRVDGFVPDQVITTFKLGISVPALLAMKDAFLAECQKTARQTYPTAIARLWCAQTNSDGLTEAYVYFLADNSTESVTNINAAKYFISAVKASAFFTTDSAGTPSSALSGPEWKPFDVRSVHPYAESQTPFPETGEGILLIALSSLLALILTGLGIYMAVRYCRRNNNAKPPRKRISVSERPSRKEVQPVSPPPTPRGRPPLPVGQGDKSFFWDRSATQFS